MQKFHVKKNDEVVVIAGTERGKRGRVLQVLARKQRVIVEGAKIIKKHTKRNRNANAAQGQIVEREGTIHISNVMLAANYDAKPGRRPAPAAGAATAAPAPAEAKT
jgi:large subunit ribosomal protein L24